MEWDKEDQNRESDDLAKAESDEFTGLLPSKVEETSYRRDVTTLISQSEAFAALIASKGWKVLEGFVEGQIKWLTQHLKCETDINKIIRLQAEILAFESLFKVIEISFVNCEQAKKHLLDIVSGNESSLMN